MRNVDVFVTASSGCSVSASDLAERGSVGDRPADRVDGVVADEEIEVRAGGTERVVAGRADLRAGLPPSVLAADDARLQTLVEARAGSDLRVRRLDDDPFTGTDAPLGGRGRVQLDLGIEGAPPQARQRAVLAFA